MTLSHATPAHQPSALQTPLSRFSESAMSVLLGRGGGDAAALGWAELHDAQGRTPLHLAALHDNAYMTRFLLEQAKVRWTQVAGVG